MSPIVAESIGLAGFATNVVGNMLLTRKNVHGWWIRILSNTLWSVYSWHEMTLSVSLNHLVFFGINVYGWHKWRKSAPS